MSNELREIPNSDKYPLTHSLVILQKDLAVPESKGSLTLLVDDLEHVVVLVDVG